MKKILFLVAFCVLTLTIKAQTASVEKTIFNIQTNHLGLWLNNETRLTNSLALRSEVGLALGPVSFRLRDKQSIFVGMPRLMFTLEPRWYYNLGKRVENSKSIAGNSGNFLSLKTTYNSNLIFRTNNNQPATLTVIPTWGIRRNIGNHFNYELGAGLGYAHVFKTDRWPSYNQFAVNLHLRFGYKF